MIKEQNVNAVNSDSVKIIKQRSGRRVNWKKNESMKVFILVTKQGGKRNCPLKQVALKKTEISVVFNKLIS